MVPGTLAPRRPSLTPACVRRSDGVVSRKSRADRRGKTLKPRPRTTARTTQIRAEDEDEDEEDSDESLAGPEVAFADSEACVPSSAAWRGVSPSPVSPILLSSRPKGGTAGVLAVGGRRCDKVAAVVAQSASRNLLLAQSASRNLLLAHRRLG
eukprot:CAMPEP_0185484824 /NCGR_PEP_ID=MMETSP1366-20130426/9597_1 /TAXON_ID=38817 /ORGANISM="Gephyrocapsa oceanica, Strain RCC1303" /LENGTH=152 /DNA_ID=CAMNT_0028092905 /DNA_START=114 /DNA_END=572 /DNA_ORIENTATION=+